MFKGEFKFDLKDTHVPLFGRSPYCRAYHTTNEPLEEWISLTPVKNPRVLTVAASGDQPLMYAAAGASHIDTFDMTIYACAVMDFKTTALQMLSNEDYKTLVRNLCYLDETCFDAFKKVINNMPERTRTLLQQIGKEYIPTLTVDCHTPTFPKSEDTLHKMRQAATKPFNFIWANIENVSHYISGKYDIINTSNIFEKFKPLTTQAIRDNIESLWPYLNDGGYILCTTTNQSEARLVELIPQLMSNFNAKVSLPKSQHQIWHPIIIQKTR